MPEWSRLLTFFLKVLHTLNNQTCVCVIMFIIFFYLPVFVCVF
jgi:hypothetical protein